MRSGMCLLTTCGLVCLALGGMSVEVMAQGQTPDPQQFTRQKSTTTQYFSRGGNPPATPEKSADGKNYSQLFGPQPAAKEPPPKAAPQGEFRAVSGTKKVADSGQENPWESQQHGKTQPLTGQEKTTQVINAGYSQFKNASKSGEVQQVRGENPFVNTAPEKTASAAAPFPGSNRVTINRAPDTVPAKTPATPSAAPETPVANPELHGTARHSQESPAVTVKWLKRSNINVGQECHCDLVVTNTSRTSPASNVVVETSFPTTVRLTSADPQPTETTDKLSWKFETLKPGEIRTIRISMTPSVRGELVTQANVRYTATAAGIFTVEEPLLKVTTEGPKEVMVGDPASQVITITNPGTGVANNVTVEALIPSGLEHPRGKRLVMEIGSLNPNESRKLRLALAAVEGGSQDIKIQATADGNLRQMNTANILVTAPSLALLVDGPGVRYKGRQAAYTLKVKNEGAASSSNVRLMHKVPEGFKFIKADRGGKYDYTTGVVSWFVGRLEPGQVAEVKIDLSAEKLGDYVHYVAVASEHGGKSEAQVKTTIEGTASLVLEIVDLDDPVEVGRETAYEIRVRNDGTKAAKNVGISCELPNGVKLLNAKGATDHVADNGLVVFKSLPVLAPGKTAVFRVHVQGLNGGNHRFRARLASDSIQEPLIFEELTKFYTD